MHEKLRRGVGMLVTAIALGVLADVLLRESPWGINVLLFAGASIAALVLAARVYTLPLTGEGRWLLLAVLAFSAAIAWRDSTVLKVANFLAILAALTLVMARGRTGAVRSLGIVQGLVCLAITAINCAFGFALLLYSEIPWWTLKSDLRQSHFASIMRGVLLAVPLLLIFGGLFAAADAAFASLVSRMFSVNPEAILLHCLFIGVGAWITGGFLSGALLRDDETLMDPGRPALISLGSIEVTVMMGALNALFLLFVCVQIPYLFGGQAHVMTTSGLTAAVYARRGFFELVTVAGLVLPLLLALQVQLRAADFRCHRRFRALAGVLILLTYLVMASAVQRMALYSIGFGLTELRFYTTAFMGFLALLFLLYAATGLRGRPGFFFGGLLCGFAVLTVLNVANPDALIVRANVDRQARHRSFDATYAAGLSADAVPTLLHSWPQLDEADRRTAASQIKRRWLTTRTGDWRIWSLGRAQAHKAAADSASTMRAYTTRTAPETVP